MKTILAFIILILSACATKPTPYEPADAHNYGYRILDQNGVAAAVFIGNKKTSIDQAKLFSTAAAYEYCDDKNLFALTSMPIVLAEKLTYIHTATGFRCMGQTRVVDGPDSLDEVGQGDVHPFTKDAKGGLIIRSLDRANKKFRKDDIIIAVNTIRVQTKVDFYKVVDTLPVGTVPIKVIRAKKTIDITTTVRDETAMLKANSDLVRSQLCSNEIAKPLRVCGANFYQKYPGTF